jgi:hypothetical protein|tara:strand:- start:146 stop:355 length:210 start_codon:yes stop_codon:yes gene_type:complete
MASAIVNVKSPDSAALIVKVKSPESKMVPVAPRVISEVAKLNEGDIEITANVDATPPFVTVTVPVPDEP